MYNATPTLRINSPGRVLPTLPGKVSGVVAVDHDEQGKSVATVQCATCLRTATGVLIFAVNWADFGGDGDRSSEYNPAPPPPIPQMRSMPARSPTPDQQSPLNSALYQAKDVSATGLE